MRVPIARRAFLQRSLALLAGAVLPQCASPRKVAASNTPKTDPQALFWQSYKNAYLRNLPKGMIAAIPYYPIKGQTPSEAMGHALMFAAQRADWGTFNALVKGLSYFKKANGVLRWRINCDGTVRPGEENLNAASETEENVAYALLIAYEKTGKIKYRNIALKLIDCIWREEVIDFQGRLILTPSDRAENKHWPYSVDSEGNIFKLAWYTAYSSPKRLRKFAKYDQTHDWNMIIESWYALANQTLEAAIADPKLFGIAGINPMPHVVWLTPQGKNGIQLKPFFPARDALGSRYSDEGDSIRIPIYVGMDAAQAQGRVFLERFYAQINLKGPQDATVRLQNHPPQNSLMAIAAYAAGLKAIGRDVSQFEHRIQIDEQGFTGDARGQYYDQTICYYAYLLLNGQFPR